MIIFQLNVPSLCITVLRQYFRFSHLLHRQFRQVFDQVTPHYDVMNDLMSLGLHRLWKWFTVSVAGNLNQKVILDLAGGTGDLTLRLIQSRYHPKQIILSDINHNMLALGRDRLINQGFSQPVICLQLDAEQLPFAKQSIDCITMGFGLRNVTNKIKALACIAKTLKPGGQCLILEFATPTSAILKNLYDWYSFHVIPKIGQYITGEASGYQYLVESIRQHPTQKKLKHMMLTAGFDDVHIHNLLGGIVALHRGYCY